MRMSRFPRLDHVKKTLDYKNKVRPCRKVLDHVEKFLDYVKILDLKNKEIRQCKNK